MEKFDVYLAESGEGRVIRTLSRGVTYDAAKDMVYCFNSGNKNPDVVYLFDNVNHVDKDDEGDAEESPEEPKEHTSLLGIWPGVEWGAPREESYHVVSRCMATGSPWVPVCTDEDLETASRIMGGWIKSNLCDSCEFKIETF